MGDSQYCAAKSDGKAPLKCCYNSKSVYESVGLEQGYGHGATIQSICPTEESYNTQRQTQNIEAAPATPAPVDTDSCEAYRSEGYECVPYYQCEDGEIIDDGAGLIDIRSDWIILVKLKRFMHI